MSQTISIQTQVNAPISKVWEYYNKPTHIVNWNNASSDWHTPKAENDFKVGGRFVYRMESVDGKNGFDFGGVYTQIEQESVLKYTIDDGRKVEVFMNDVDGKTNVDLTFEAETENSLELQREGWQAILDNFKNYVESN